MDLLISLATNENFKCLDIQMGGAYCRWGDGASQSHLLHTDVSGKAKTVIAKSIPLAAWGFPNDVIYTVTQ